MDAPLPPGFAGWEAPAPRKWWAEPKWIVVIVVVAGALALGLYMMSRNTKSSEGMNPEQVKQVVYSTLHEIQDSLDATPPAPVSDPSPPTTVVPQESRAPPAPPPPPQALGEEVGMALREPDPPMRFGDDVPVTAERPSL